MHSVPSKTILPTVLSSLAICLYFERISVLLILLQERDFMLLHEFNPVEGYIPCKFWLDLAINLQCTLKLNPHPIFARDKLAWVKY